MPTSPKIISHVPIIADILPQKLSFVIKKPFSQRSQLHFSECRAQPPNAFLSLLETIKAPRRIFRSNDIIAFHILYFVVCLDLDLILHISINGMRNRKTSIGIINRISLHAQPPHIIGQLVQRLWASRTCISRSKDIVFLMTIIHF